MKCIARKVVVNGGFYHGRLLAWQVYCNIRDRRFLKKNREQ